VYGLDPAFADMARDTFDHAFMRGCLEDRDDFAHSVDYLTDGGKVLGCLHPGGIREEPECFPATNIKTCMSHCVGYLRYRRVTVATFVQNMAACIAFLYNLGADWSCSPTDRKFSIRYLLQRLTKLLQRSMWEDEDDEPLQFTAWLIQVPYADGCRVVAAYWTIGATLCAHMLWPE
jgi:hypothetical protein